VLFPISLTGMLKCATDLIATIVVSPIVLTATLSLRAKQSNLAALGEKAAGQPMKTLPAARPRPALG